MISLYRVNETTIWILDSDETIMVTIETPGLAEIPEDETPHHILMSAHYKPENEEIVYQWNPDLEEFVPEEAPE